MGLVLPDHPTKTYSPANICIYCGAKDDLTDEHIVPYGAGGRWTFPRSSCRPCAVQTGRFEGQFLRTVWGPLRMLYDVQSRRRKERPKYLPLKVKYPDSVDWEIVQVDRKICPFLVLMPLYPMPEALTGLPAESERGPGARTLWIRGTKVANDLDAHLQRLCHLLGAVEIMPTGVVEVEPVCLTVAKVAHAFATAELGMGAFEPFLDRVIREGDLSNRAWFLGGGKGNEPASDAVHDVAFATEVGVDPNVIAVRVRLLGVLETPSYHVAVGRKILGVTSPASPG